jgi:hypothetical protein
LNYSNLFAREKEKGVLFICAAFADGLARAILVGRLLPWASSPHLKHGSCPHGGGQSISAAASGKVGGGDDYGGTAG